MVSIFDLINDAEKLNKIYTPNQLGEFLHDIGKDYKTIKTNKKISYYNIPCAFDIETTSYYLGNVKCSVMYEWTLGVNFRVIYGRTWEEFIEVYSALSNHFETNVSKRLIIYAHNLSFEFQAFRKRFEWEKVFSLKERKPVQCVTSDGIEFRCSYILSGYSLENLGKQLVKYKVSKLIGNLDYSLSRHEKTQLSKEELKYCVNDVLVVMAYIQEKIELDGDITKIPLTKTGYVRKACRNSCLYSDNTHRKDTEKFHKYMKLMRNLTIEPKEYELLKEGFMGGFTHANPYFSRGIFHDVSSFDFTSSYPSVMVSEKFPMTKGKFVKIESKEDFNRYLKNYCCLFEVAFDNIRPRKYFENYIPASKCRHLKKSIENNGRVYSAEHLEITITEQDYFIINELYDWDNMILGDFIIYGKGYLPKDLVLAILDFYTKKTELKGIEGKEVEYMVSKENVNSCYGMMVTDICREEVLYENEIWGKNAPKIEESLKKYNFSKRRFLFYPWGIWVTAYARYNLFTGICEFGEDYIYSDTDSLKVKNTHNHLGYIKAYNDFITKKIEIALKHHNIDLKYLHIKNKDGKEKPMGVWDFEGTYDRFKTLGAKRYLTEKNGELSLTVAGLNKKVAVPYLIDTFKDKVFENFDDDLYIPSEHTGKMTHTYIDCEVSGYITDYLGNKQWFNELSGTHLEPCDFTLSMAEKYVDFLLGLEDNYIQ